VQSLRNPNKTNRRSRRRSRGISPTLRGVMTLLSIGTGRRGCCGDGLDRTTGANRSLPAERLLALLRTYERSRIAPGAYGAFTYLHWASDTSDARRGRYLQRATERGSRLNRSRLHGVGTRTPRRTRRRQHGWPTRRWPAIVTGWSKIRRYRPAPAERPGGEILSEKAVTGRNAWDRFFDEVHGAAQYDFDGQKTDARPSPLAALFTGS